ncbi:helix-turn-helix domain-containing protein [Echinicola soli]|uniref:Helix-turn-helix domain-containing protein n=1 Tax=Echinicola soli TaxID=2591634 RepID=A0A514CFG6_9BACT|nr:AraC family transcriptional regulator [Echinicola soli]QDH78562.1 helix-turn-helix domain-containing protein [Echinicola soli]
MVKKIRISDKLMAPFSFMPNNLDEELSILWNVGEITNVKLDGYDIEIGTNCILFVSEFYMNLQATTGTFRFIKFNKTFINPVETMANTGEYLMIFYGLHALNHLPKILIREEELPMFEQIWQNFLAEAKNINNPISEALLRNSFQRFLLISQKKHAETELDIPIDFKDLKLIREFQYLVNANFKELKKVSDYASILKVSPKKISEIFGCCYSKKASELIASRRNLFAKRQLIHTDELIKNIAYDLNFSDSQAFSHFFKRQNGITPDEFRSKNQGGALS